MLLPRILTGIVGAALLLGAIYFGSLPFFFIVLGVVMLAVREFYFLAEETGYPCLSGHRSGGQRAGRVLGFFERRLLRPGDG